MRTIVIGDIHGCYDELKDLMETLEEEYEYRRGIDKLVFLGDYIDRGNNSRLVIEFIRNLQENNDNVIALMGNHEDMLLNYYKGIDDSWTFNGHNETLKSYKIIHSDKITVQCQLSTLQRRIFYEARGLHQLGRIFYGHCHAGGPAQQGPQHPGGRLHRIR